MINIYQDIIEENKIFQTLEKANYSHARIRWHRLLNTFSQDSKERFTISFLSAYFGSIKNQDWMDQLSLIWIDIQDFWPEPEDYIKIYKTAIRELDTNLPLKEVIVTSLLQSGNSPSVIRECYRMAPEGSEVHLEALIQILQRINTALIKKPKIKVPYRSDRWKSGIISPALTSALFITNCPQSMLRYDFTEDSKLDSLKLVRKVEQTILDNYTDYRILSESIIENKDEILKSELRSIEIVDSIRRIGDVYGVSSKENAPRDIIEIFERYYISQLNAQKNYIDIINRISDINDKKIEFEKQRDLVLGKIDEINSNNRRTIGENWFSCRPFGNVDKPIERFLAYCEDITKDILIQCIYLVLEKSSTQLPITQKTLPTWIIEGFETWWHEPKLEPYHSSRVISLHPLLTFNSRKNEVQIVLPKQSIVFQEGLDHVDLVLRDNTKIIREKELPLYSEEGVLHSSEVILTLDSPSPLYFLELSTRSEPWTINAFPEEGSYLFFDYESGRQVIQDPYPKQRFFLLTSKRLSITPEIIILETGRLFGDWNKYIYFLIDPTLSSSVSIGDGISTDLPFLDVQFDPEIFDKYIRINDNLKVILGSPPKILILFNDIEILPHTVLSIHPSPNAHCSIEKPIFFKFNENSSILQIDKEKNNCSLDIGHKDLLGSEPIGHLTIRIRNKVCRTDMKIECVFLPRLSYRFSLPIYLPGNTPSLPVQLHIDCANPIEFDPEKTTMMVKKNTEGIVLSSELTSNIRGKFTYWINQVRAFSASISFPIPQLIWRFEDERNGKIWPIQRAALTISDMEYEEFGTDLVIVVFLPETLNGRGCVSMSPQKQDIWKKIEHGRVSFPIARFNDTLKVSSGELITFDLSIFPQVESEIHCLLFSIQRWNVQLTEQKVTTDKSGKRIIQISWKETVQAHNRSIILWKSGRAEEKATSFFEADIQENEFKYKIIPKSELLSGIYYLQFFKKRDKWETTPTRFAGEMAPNTFQIIIDINYPELLREADELFERGKYFQAIEQYRKNPGLESYWKQKIMNRLIYPRDFSGAIECFQQILPKQGFLKETDYNFISFRLVTDLITQPHFLNFSLCLGIVNTSCIIIDLSDSIPKRIICSHIKEIQKGLHSIEDLSDEELQQIRIHIKFMKDKCNYKEPQKPHEYTKIKKRPRKKRRM